MSVTTTAATFAYRVTAQGVESVEKAFDRVAGRARSSMGETSRATQASNRELDLLASKLDKVARGIDGFRKLRDVFLGLYGLRTLKDTITNSLEAAGSIGDLAKSAGLGARQFQELQFALKGFGVTQDQVLGGLRSFNVAAAEFVTKNSGPGKDAFKALGFDQKAVQQGLRNIDLFFEQVLQRISTKAPAAQQALSKALFGKEGGASFLPAASDIQGLRAAREEAEKLGYVLSDDLIKASNDASNRLTVLGDLLQRRLLVAVGENADEIERFANVAIENLPTIIHAFEGLIEVVGGTASAVGTLLKGMNDLYDATIRFTRGESSINRAATVAAINDQFFSPDATKAAARPVPYGPSRSLFNQPSGATLTIGNDAATDAQIKAREKLIEGLKQEIAAVGQTAREQAILREQMKLGADATEAQKNKVRELAGALYDANKAQDVRKLADSLRTQTELLGQTAREQAILADISKISTGATAAQVLEIERLSAAYYDAQQRQKAFAQAGEAINDAFLNLTTSTDKWSDSLRNLGRQLINIAQQQLLSGGGGGGVGGLLTSALSSGFSYLSGSFGSSGTSIASTKVPGASYMLPARASGGPVGAGQDYWVGERGPEILRMGSQGGTVIPNHAIGKGGLHIEYLDARGADREGLAELQQTITRLNGKVDQINNSIESRAMSAVQDRAARSLTYLRR